MYRVLIVDDEKIERTGIKFLLGQIDCSFETYEAVNGKEAEEWLRDNQADILITDIKMPFMDGLELLEQIDQLYPDMVKIIISGYGEFSYAKKAIRYGVEEYILKPVDPEDFKVSIEKVVQTLDEKRAVEASKQIRVVFFKEYVLNALLNGMPVEELEKMSIGYYPLDFLRDYRRMMLVEVTGEFFDNKDFSEVPFGSWKMHAPVDHLNMNARQSILFFTEECENWKELAKNICENIQTKCGDKLKCYVAVSSGISTPSQIPERYKELEFLMENRFYSLESSIYMAEHEVNAVVDVCLDDDTLMKQLKQDIRGKNLISLREHFEMLFSSYRKGQKFSQIYVKFMSTNLLKMVSEAIPHKTEDQTNEDVEKLYNAVGIFEILEILEENIRMFEDYVQKDFGVMRREVEEVKKYIYTHYGEELSVDILAEQVYLTPGYLSTIFRKETGQNLSKFIKAYRMEKAREMLENTREKIVTISEKVGYPNTSYFCQNFREYFGISPQKYRDKGEAYEQNP